MNPFVSIILPLYNVEKYLKNCLLSIQNQNYDNFEVICINDGSTDKSADIYKETVGNDPRFSLYEQKNQGLSYVRNLGMKLAKGDLITFVDSDDTITPDYLMVLVKGIVEHDCDISIGAHNMIYSKFTLPVKFPKSRIMTSQQALSYLMADFMIMNYSWAKCYKKELWDGIEFPVSHLYEDVETIYKTFLKAKKIYVSNQPIYNYAIRPGSISQSKLEGRNRHLKRAYMNQMNGIAKIYPKFKKFGYFNCFKADIMYFYDQIIMQIKK